MKSEIKKGIPARIRECAKLTSSGDGMFQVSCRI